MSEALIAAPRRDIARVAVDVALPHLDRPFDYEVPEAMRETALPGVRVRVRFAGRLRDGYVLERRDDTDVDGPLHALEKVISEVPVLTSRVAGVVRAVADYYAGTFSDVVRLAIPPRHATTEKAAPKGHPAIDPSLAAGVADPWSAYPTGVGLLTALRAGATPRAFWQTVPASIPAGDWALGLALAAAATAASGRGSLLVVPDHRDLRLLEQACTRVLGPSTFVTLTADLGPAARYRAFLATLRGEVRVVIGTRAAAFAPVQNLGLVGLWDDGDDLHSEPRAPYPHVREVLAMRAAQEQTALIIAAHGRTCEVQQWVERGWLRELALPARDQRRLAAAVRVTADTDFDLTRDPHAATARLPREVFEVIRTGLAQGPVLIQVPRAGYLVVLVCAECREPVRCPSCNGPVRGGPSRVSCGWCGRPVTGWRCPECGSGHWRVPVVGAVRTGEELGKAFPNTAVLTSSGDKVIAEVGDKPGLIIATPGAEPRADAGYAAAVLLDTPQFLMRADLRAGEEALRRWCNALALVRSGSEQGTVLAVGPSDSRVLQALVRSDPGSFAARELAERRESRLTPAAKLIGIEGSLEALTEFGELVELPDEAELLGPVEGWTRDANEPAARLTIRCPVSGAREVVAAVRAAAGVRSARKSEGALRIRVDPVVV